MGSLLMFPTALVCILAVSLGQSNALFKQFSSVHSAIEGTELTLQGKNGTRFRFAEQCLSFCVDLSECDAAAYNRNIMDCKLFSSSKVSLNKNDDDWKTFKQVLYRCFILF